MSLDTGNTADETVPDVRAMFAERAIAGSKLPVPPPGKSCPRHHHHKVCTRLEYNI